MEPYITGSLAKAYAFTPYDKCTHNTVADDTN